MTAIRCHCPSCRGTIYMRLSDWLHAHPDLDPDAVVLVDLEGAVERHPSNPT